MIVSERQESIGAALVGEANRALKQVRAARREHCRCYAANSVRYMLARFSHACRQKAYDMRLESVAGHLDS